MTQEINGKLKSRIRESMIRVTEPASGSARSVVYPRRVFFWESV